MTNRPRPAQARASLSRLPRWVPVLGVVLVLGEVTGAAILLPGGGGPRAVVLQVSNAYSGDGATYTTPAGDGQFEMPADTPPLGQASTWQAGPTVSKTVSVPSGGTVTISTFNGYGGMPLTCSISVNGTVVSKVPADGFWARATCRATVP